MSCSHALTRRPSLRGGVVVAAAVALAACGAADGDTDTITDATAATAAAADAATGGAAYYPSALGLRLFLDHLKETYGA